MPDGGVPHVSNATELAPKDKKRRKVWLQQLHTWHWVSSALCLMGMLLFSITGITLNHAGQIEAQPTTERTTADVPAEVMQALANMRQGSPVPLRASDWMEAQFDVKLDGREIEWSPEELYVSLPRPGGDAWLSIDLAVGVAEHEVTNRGWISYFNDLHKGRHTGTAWSWFIDLFAVASLVFCVTGLLLLQLHSKHRPATWPTVGAGLAVMLIIMIAFIH